MRSGRFHTAITWAIILTQLLTLVIGYGWVVVCHDENGTSHIELVDQDSCSIQSDDPCTQRVSSRDKSDLTGSCSDSACVDEPLGFLATRPSDRNASDNAPQSDQPDPSLAVIAWMHSQHPLDVPHDRALYDNRHAILALHRSSRSIILVL